MMTTNSTFNGSITRQLSDISFETSDPIGCFTWLQDIGGVPLPRRGPREFGRVRTIGGGVIIVYHDGLVIAFRPINGGR